MASIKDGNSISAIDDKKKGKTEVDIKLLHKLINETLMPSAISILEPADNREVEDKPRSKTYEKWKGFMEEHIVLVFAAFAVVYGESSLMADQTGTLAESIMLMKQSPDKSKLRKIRKLIDAMIQVTNTSVNIGNLPPEKIETVVSGTVRSILICTSHITGSVGFDEGDAKDDDDHLSKLTKKVEEMRKKLSEEPPVNPPPPPPPPPPPTFIGKIIMMYKNNQRTARVILVSLVIIVVLIGCYQYWNRGPEISNHIEVGTQFLYLTESKLPPVYQAQYGNRGPQIRNHIEIGTQSLYLTESKLPPVYKAQYWIKILIFCLGILVLIVFPTIRELVGNLFIQVCKEQIKGFWKFIFNQVCKEQIKGFWEFTFGVINTEGTVQMICGKVSSGGRYAISKMVSLFNTLSHIPGVNLLIKGFFGVVNCWGYPSTGTTTVLNMDVNVIVNNHAHDGKNLKLNLLNPLCESINKILIDEGPCYGVRDTLLVVVTYLLSCTCSGGENYAESKTVSLFETMPQYSWEANMVLALAAFSIMYEESWRMANLSNRFANSIKLLKQIPDKSKLLKIRSHINAMVKVTNTIVEVVKVKASQPEKISTLIQETVSWTVWSLIVCTSQIIGLDGKYTLSELSKLTNKVNEMNTDLGKELVAWHLIIDEDKKEGEARIEKVADSLRKEGLTSSNLIIGIDFSESNTRTGQRTFKRRSLHDICGSPNPYQQAIEIIGKTLASFANDNKIYCYGFGDATTKDDCVFSFHNDRTPCQSFNEVLTCYNQIVQKVRLAGPTCYAPIIEAAIDIVEKSGGQHHVLVIIADDSIKRDVETNSIITASGYALSIVYVGVGDGPWHEMNDLAAKIDGRRKFDNLQFVHFYDIMKSYENFSEQVENFSRVSTKKIPMQYKASKEQGLLGLISQGRRLLDVLFSLLCMAGNGTKNGKKTSVTPHISLATLLFFLLIVARTTGKREQDLSTAPPDTRSINASNLQSYHPLAPSPKRSRPNLLWRKRVFNAGDHEVPSGPNPISNRK
ncbi:hypothetical protein NE237_000658 [Protea cynaroides]|uniref:VWFA domain-containing protein n=1 Tax=Protea cynaroides TaxID=273540 RepID=A0A9Q0QXN4_9MAGN|nr:hypothetical protein NE237_000658 [Protea cynaroides]